MKYVNIIYDEDGNDTDILLVPDQVSHNIDEIGQAFFDWLSKTKDHGYWRVAEDGHKYLAAGTDEFVKWLKDNYGNLEDGEIRVIERDTKYNPKYPYTYF